MRGICVRQFGGPEVLKMEELPTPEPGPGQVLVSIRAAGVNPVDTYIRSGTYHLKPELPFTPGKDGAGVVAAVGPGISSLRVGDRVYTAGSLTGTYAQAALCEAGQVHPLPEAVSFAAGAGVNVPYAAAYRALFQRAHALPGEWVLVHGGTGGVGLAAIQLAASAGMRIIATGGSPEGRALAEAQGADAVFDHHASGYLDQVRETTGGSGVDVILEMLANVNLGRDLGVLAKGGRVVVVGSRGNVEINPRDAMQRDAAIMGMLLMNATEQEIARIHAALGAGLGNGSLRPVVGREFPLQEAPQAHRAVLKPGAAGNLVLIP